MGVVKEGDFMTINEADMYGVCVIETTEKERSLCERTMEVDDKGGVTCDCPKRQRPEVATEKYIQGIYKAAVSAAKDSVELKSQLVKAIRENFTKSSLNTCMTQKLTCMDVEPMSVQLKKGMENKRL